MRTSPRASPKACGSASRPASPGFRSRIRPAIKQNRYDLDVAVARMRAARAAIDTSKTGVVLTGRAECFLIGLPDLNEAIRRLVAYGEAGADCLYAPGIRTREQIAAVVKAVAPKPVNVLVSHASELAVSDLAGMGVRRISTGSGLARAAWGGFIRAARGIAETGKFDGLAGATPNPELNGFFRDDLGRRGKS
jgi:2-methylisocitrate lyase-like PEP mutase family enzyme